MKIKLLHYLFLIFVLILSTQASAQEEVIAYKLDAKTARNLLIDTDDELKNISPPVHYQGFSQYNPKFYLFWSIFDRNAHAYYAVNPWTGGVWDLWLCQTVSTPKSLKLQDKIHKRFTADELTQYDRLSALKPVCWN